MFVIVSSTVAVPLSRAIMRLLRPESVREEDWTDLYCEVFTHPTTGQTAIRLPEDERVPIHHEATGAELRALLDQFVVDGSITAAERDGIGSAIIANAGQVVRIADFVPPSWAANVRTASQMDADGWFPEASL
jgi:hypothetical protein